MGHGFRLLDNQGIITIDRVVPHAPGLFWINIEDMSNFRFLWLSCTYEKAAASLRCAELSMKKSDVT